jgi:primosomal protein N''
VNYLLENVKHKEIDFLYDYLLRKAEQNIDKTKQRSSKFYYNLFNFESNGYYLRELDVYRSREDNFNEINYNLDVFYFAEKMKLALSLLSRAVTTKSNQSNAIETAIPLIEDIKTYLSKTDINNFPYLIQLYYRTLMVCTNKDEIMYFLELKALLTNFDASVPENVVDDITNSIETYCAGKINSGHPEFNNYALEIYKIMIANRIITSNGVLSPWRFKNIISLATWMKEFDWLENFITEYAQYLPADFRENAVTFNLARINFEKRQYEKVITLLREVEYEDLTYNLQSKSMLLMTYYDTNEFDALDYIIESFRVFLNRHKEIPKQRQTYFKNLIKFTKKLSRVIPNDEKAIQKIKQEIEQTPGFKVRWLEEKIAMLEAGR